MSDVGRITELEHQVSALLEIIGLQGSRIDRLEAEVEMRDTSIDVALARQAADKAMAMARGAAVLASARAGQ